MDGLPPAPTGVPPRAPLSALRRHQRRLLWGGGGVISLLVLLTLLVALGSEVNAFHESQRERFAQARASIDYFLFQRDRAYATSINTNDALWGSQQPLLRARGAALAVRLQAQGGQVLVRDAGPTAVPWLVLVRQPQALPVPTLEAYLGMVAEYSTYTAANVSALRSEGRMALYGYEPEGRLIAVAGVTDEAQLLRALGVDSRDAAFSRLMAMEPLAQSRQVGPGPVQSAVASGRMLSYFDTSPTTGQPSLVGVQTMSVGRVPYFRRVVFEPVQGILERLDAHHAGELVVLTADGRTVLRTGGMPTPRLDPAQGRTTGADGEPVRSYRDGRFLLSGRLVGVDWTLVSGYDWHDLWVARGMRMLAQGLAALSILTLLWWLLLRLQRRVFAPALQDASQVYESEALSRVIIDTSPIGLVLMAHESGEVLLENALARQLAGTPGESGDADVYARLRAHARAHATDATHEFACTTTTAEGGLRRLQVAMALASWHQRRVWVCALRDVTAQAELERTLRHARRDAERARAAAESASLAKTAFVATMSHEIRTPLNGVLGHLELLGRSPLAPSQRERLDRIRLSADSLMGIISDVLDFSKIEAGQLDIVAAPFTVRPLVEQATLLFSAQALRKGVKLYYAIDPALEQPLVADVHRIRQILNNLLANAVKFTESGRIVVRARWVAATQDAPARLSLQVVDSGIGLSEDQQAQLFQPFQQADNSISRRYGGSGLGLALCQQLAQLLGGGITADSTLGVGSVFTLDVPVSAVDVQPDDPVAQDTTLRGQRITLLSAASEWRTEIGQLLRRWGAEVTVIEQPRQVADVPAGTTLLLYGERRAWDVEEEDSLVGRHVRTVRALPHGPLSPEVRPDGVHVSAYASSALRAALADDWTPDTGAPALPTTRGDRGEVLLVEDNPVNRELIQQQLEELGFVVESAGNGQEALVLWQPGRYRAVLTDINMPVMDGYQLAAALRTQGASLPILAITATALASERERCRQAGISDLLLKPLNLLTLSRALTQHLGDAPVAAGAEAEPESESESESETETETETETTTPPLPTKLRRTFVDSTRGDIDALVLADASGDRQALLDRLHALKGVLMMVGEREAGGICGQLEAQLREGEPALPLAGLAALVARLEQVLARHAAQLE